jgi:hypothetical protein
MKTAAVETTTVETTATAVAATSALSCCRQYRQATDEQEPRYVAHMHASYLEA